MGYNAPGSSYGALAGRPAGTEGPLVVVFERDDSIAVPLLSHLRMAGYDVRGARTPVELFDALQKHPVALVLIDLGSAATGRREFWVALDAQRRGRTAQVLTFRFLSDGNTGELDFDLSARALADVEVRGPQDLQVIIDAVLARVPVSGAIAPVLSGRPLGGAGIATANPFTTPAPGTALGGNTPPPYGNGYANGNGYDTGYANGYGAPYSPPPGYPAPPGFGYSDPAAGAGFAPPGFPPNDPSAGFAFPAPFGHMAPQGPGSFGAGDPLMGGYGAGTDPLGQQPSAFGSPAPGNPFATGGAEPSPFAQPLNGNPFASQGPALGAGGPPVTAPVGPYVPPNGYGTPPDPFGAAAQNGFANPAPQNPFAPGSDFGASSQYGGPSAPRQNGHQGMNGFQPLGGGSGPVGWSGPPGLNGQNGQNGYDANPFGGAPAASQTTAPFAPAPSAHGDPHRITDAWTPPGGADPEPAPGPNGPPPRVAPSAPGGGWGTPEPFRPLADDTDVAFPTYDTASAQLKRQTPQPRPAFDETAPAPANLPALTGPLNPADRALGAVLVEGSLLSPRKLDVLKGIQQMLGSVEMDFKLGELALLFKFLSPDQLLAALLVSRGIVTPQQIAGLGRIKQELGGSGMDYDLETLLVMFHILPAEELRALRKELM